MHLPLKIVLVLVLLGLSFSPAAFAGEGAGPVSVNTVVAVPAYECTLSGTTSSGMGGCVASAGGGVNTVAQPIARDSTSGACSGTYLCATKSVASTSAVVPIKAWGIGCTWVDNTSSNSIFVPFSTQAEWTAFTGNVPSGINLVPCSLPATCRPIR